MPKSNRPDFHANDPQIDIDGTILISFVNLDYKFGVALPAL